MPDITMCKSSRCPLSSSCYRYKATPTEYFQSYFVDLEPVIDDNGVASCDYYSPCTPCPECDEVDYHKTTCPTLANL